MPKCRLGTEKDLPQLGCKEDITEKQSTNKKIQNRKDLYIRINYKVSFAQ